MATPPATRRSFESSLERLAVDLTPTTPEQFDATLERVVTEPAVATALDFDGVSLPSWVETKPTPRTLEAAKTGITPAAFAIAAYGSIVVPESPPGTEPVSLFPERHVAVLHERDLVSSMREAMARLGPQLRAGESAILATGPSATADMGALVRGAHGPKDVHVILLESADDQRATGSDR